MNWHPLTVQLLCLYFKLQHCESEVTACVLAEQHVKEQADRVRHLKETEGLAKGDPVLDEAIEELLKRKQSLEKL